MLSSIRNSVSQIPHERRGARASRAPAPGPGPRAEAPSRGKAEVFDPAALDALLDGLYGDDEPAPEPEDEVNVPEYLAYRDPTKPTHMRGRFFDLFA